MAKVPSLSVYPRHCTIRERRRSIVHAHGCHHGGRPVDSSKSLGGSRFITRFHCKKFFPRLKCIYFVSYEVIMICKEILACILKFSTTPWAKVLRCGGGPSSLAPSQIGFPDRHRSRAGWAQRCRCDGMYHSNCPDYLVA